jgi:demethylmenaquinone methyltransferase/2-methoxy-6-polyprenyl-1,4-benzoquinol methylase
MPSEVQIKSMFNNISGSYDLLNDLMSLGIHRIWKKNLVASITQDNPKAVLDCATGTGDIAISVKNALPNARVAGGDFSENMLQEAIKKTDKIDWSVSDVMKLDFADNEFEVSSISYGIRNVEDHKLALKEMARVSSKKVCVLEFGQPQFTPFKMVYFAIMNYFMPFMGKLFKKEEAYKYLVDSSKSFPCADEFASQMKEATGFNHVECKSFFGGVTYLYIASNK